MSSKTAGICLSETGEKIIRTLKASTILAPVAAVAALGAGAAEAAESSSARVATMIEEVVVTARKREESLQETPISITAFSADDLKARNITNLTELQFSTPGLTSNLGAAGGSTGQYFIRGIGQSDWIAAFEPGVGIYVDGVYLGRVTGAALDLVDVSRIEVLRGPQGTLFGRNTIGGAISIVSKAPSFEHEGQAEVTYGERDHLAIKGGVSGPLVADQLAARFSFNAETKNGHGVRLVDGERQGDKEVFAARGALRWTPGEDITIDLVADVTHQTGTGDFAKLKGINEIYYPNTAQYVIEDRRSTWSGLDTPNDNDTWGVSLTVDYAITPEISIKSITAYRDLQAQSGMDFDGTPGSYLEQLIDTEQDQFSQELQLSGRAIDDRLDWLVGFYYFEEDIRQLADVTIDLAPFFFRVHSPQLNVLDNKSVAGFAQATFKITDQLSLTAGARYTDEKKEIFYDHTQVHQAGSFLPEGFVQVIVPPQSVDDSWSSFTPKVGLEYQVTDDLMVYASYSEGFRSGGFNGRPQSVNVITPFDPEKVKVWEGGFKSDLLDNRLRVNGAVFWNDYTDLQLASTVTIGGAPALTVGNAGKSELKGGELEVTAAPVEGLLLNVGVAYLDQKFTQLDPGVLLAGGLTLDSRQPNTPKWQVNAGIQYTADLGDAGLLTGRMDYSYKSAQTFFLGDPLETQKNENVVNARLTYETPGDHWQLSVYALNLFDENYNAFQEADMLNYGIDLIWPAPPREIGVTVGYRF